MPIKSSLSIWRRTAFFHFRGGIIVTEETCFRYTSEISFNLTHMGSSPAGPCGIGSEGHLIQDDLHFHAMPEVRGSPPSWCCGGQGCCKVGLIM